LGKNPEEKLLYIGAKMSIIISMKGAIGLYQTLQGSGF
jgi:hypothetical protein